MSALAVLPSTATTAITGDTLGGWDALVEQYLRHRLGQRTLSWASARNSRSHLTRFAELLADVPVHELAPEHIERWKESRSHLAASSRRGQFSTVRSFCAWLVKAGYLLTNPALEIPAPREPRSVCRAMNAEDVGAVLDIAPDSRGRAIVWLMLGMGLRCCEVAQLELGHWNRRAEEMTVRGKGSHERVVAVPGEVAAALLAYLDEHPATAGPLIRSYRRPGQALTADTLSGMVSEWMRAAGVKRASRDGVSAHALRATAASDILDACNDLRVVQEFLGHENLSTTAIYLRRAGLPKMRKAMADRRKYPRRPTQATLFGED